MSEDDLGEGWRQAAIDFRAERDKREKKPKVQPPTGGWPSWHSRLARDARKRIIADFDNVMIALRADPEMEFAIAYDEMMQHSIVTREWPLVDEANPPPRPLPREVSDDDVSGLEQWLQRMGIRRVGREIVGQAVEHLARERPQHPIRDYLDNLVWDGESRLETWLFTHLGAQAETDGEIEYVRAIGKMFLIALVARIQSPGCQADYMLVLEGEQGILKSSACRKLVGDEWFSDGLPERISSKDTRQHLRGKWLVEVPELATFTKAEVESLKAFITRREEKYRPPFGRHDVAEKRQCLFIGTTNQDVYIKDPTGGRRFWPVKTTTIDVAGLEQERDQLFAEAVVAYRNKEPHWPSAEFERTHFKPQQLKRQEDDVWQERIAEHLQIIEENRTTIGRIATGALGFPSVSQVGKADQNRIMAVLKELGWAAGARTGTGRWYIRPTSVTV